MPLPLRFASAMAIDWRCASSNDWRWLSLFVKACGFVLAMAMACAMQWQCAMACDFACALPLPFDSAIDFDWRSACCFGWRFDLSMRCSSLLHCGSL